MLNIAGAMKKTIELPSLTVYMEQSNAINNATHSVLVTVLIIFVMFVIYVD